MALQYYRTAFSRIASLRSRYVGSVVEPQLLLHVGKVCTGNDGKIPTTEKHFHQQLYFHKCAEMQNKFQLITIELGQVIDCDQ